MEAEELSHVIVTVELMARKQKIGHTAWAMCDVSVWGRTDSSSESISSFTPYTVT